MPGSDGAAATDRTAVTLTALHRKGRLAADYPLVRTLLAGLDDAELAKAGRLLIQLDPQEVLREHPSIRSLTVAVTGHSTLGTLIPQLTAELARHGLLMRPYLADFDSYVFELGANGSALYQARPDLVLCVLDPTMVFDEVAVPWTVADVERVLDEKLAALRTLAGQFGRHGHGTLVFNTLPLPRRFAMQLVDYRSRARLGAAWRAANTRLLLLGEQFPSVTTLDLDPLLTGEIPGEDTRMSAYAKLRLSPGLLAAYAREAGHLARHLAGNTKKVLVCDLDGTLWGGVLGEDGPAGIEVGDGLRGEAFTAFQKVIKQLGSQGVLLAVASKNETEPVAAVLRYHPGLMLRPADFVRVNANWRPKTDNIADLAEALNVGLDSFVFVDDSPAEGWLVRQAFPEVAVVQLDDEPALHVEKLLRDGWFDVRELTTEDRARTMTYRVELERKNFLASFESVQDYLRELRVWVRLSPVTEPEIARTAQLTLRTNQFNLTTQRLQPAVVRSMAAGPATQVLVIQAGDRFGDNGIVGAIFIRADSGTWHIDNFLLSCRVFSRGIEGACLSAVLRRAKAKGAAAVEAAFRASPKNDGVRDFYPLNGFVRTAGLDGELSFRHDLTGIAELPEHVQLIQQWERTDGGYV
jgi:FkbH-like protein